MFYILMPCSLQQYVEAMQQHLAAADADFGVTESYKMRVEGVMPGVHHSLQAMRQTQLHQNDQLVHLHGAVGVLPAMQAMLADIHRFWMGGMAAMTRQPTAPFITPAPNRGGGSGGGGGNPFLEAFGGVAMGEMADEPMAAADDDDDDPKRTIGYDGSDRIPIQFVFNQFDGKGDCELPGFFDMDRDYRAAWRSHFDTKEANLYSNLKAMARKILARREAGEEEQAVVDCFQRLVDEKGCVGINAAAKFLKQEGHLDKGPPRNSSKKQKVAHSQANEAEQT